MTATTFWLAAILIFGAVEAFTVGLVSIWFALGAAAAFIVSLVVKSIWVQGVVFVVESLAAMLLIRPLTQRWLVPKVEPTNADRVIDREGVVIQSIDNLNATGRISVGGVEWAARGEEDLPIPSGTRVRVLGIEGVKVIVRPEAAREKEKEE